MSILASVVVPMLFLSPAPAPAPPTPEDLRSRIRELRHGLLTGGDMVREAEADAMKFYQQKIEDIDRGLDSITADLTERRATYEVTLDRILRSSTIGSEEARKASIAGASGLLAEVQALETEQEALQARRAGFQQAIRIVRKRSRERERLALKLESSSVAELPGLILPSLGLAPEPAPRPDPLLADTELVQDLLRRDPVLTRRLLFEVNPEAYWARWPLRPPADVLLRALPFPRPDLPGRR